MKQFVFITILFINSIIYAGTYSVDSTDVIDFFIDGKKYELVTSKMTWLDASHFSFERGGMLAEICSQEEQDSIFSFLITASINVGSTKAPDGGNASYVWLGGNDIDEEGIWIWDGANDGIKSQFWEGTVTGNAIDSLYNNWGNEPDNFNNQDALGMALTRWPRGSEGQWNDINAGNELFFIVEYDSSIIKIDSLGYLYDQNSIIIKRENNIEYDSLCVVVNDTIFDKLYNLTESDSFFVTKYDVDYTQNVNVRLFAYANDIIANSRLHFLEILSFKNPVQSFETDFEDTNPEDFSSLDFTIEKVFPFRNKSLHSPHDYESFANLNVVLSKSIIVEETNPFLSYSEVVVVEPGDSGSVFGDDGFKDYVIVEGSKEINIWEPLVDGYDSRYNSDWENLWYNGGLFRNFFSSHTINLTNTFAPGDTILIRFRIKSDEEINGWGWVIDDLSIQTTPLGNHEYEKLPNSYELKQNYPNPFNPSTTINFTIPRREYITLKIYNSLGELVNTAINNAIEAGNYNIEINSSMLPSGVYFYRLSAKNFTSTKKMILVK